MGPCILGLEVVALQKKQRTVVGWPWHISHLQGGGWILFWAIIEVPVESITDDGQVLEASCAFRYTVIDMSFAYLR